jgi:putative Ca2+/H+ antiporter (TMEM165/GDT1 family)
MCFIVFLQKSDQVKSEVSHPLGNVYGFIHGFVASVSVIIVSELGDKTFFIAAIMAMKYPRMTVFAGALSALGFMTVLSAALGYATTVIPRKFTFYVSTALFVYFGLKMLHEGYTMDPNEGQVEYEEVQAELKKKEEEVKWYFSNWSDSY